MTSEIIELKSVEGSEDQLRHVRERLEKALRELRSFAVLCVLASVAGIALAVATHDWKKGILPLAIGLGFLIPFGRLLPLRHRLSRFETRYAITEKGLRVGVFFDGKRAFPATVIEWREIVNARQEPEAVALRFRNGGEILIQNACFPHPEDRSELLSRARGAAIA